MPGPTVTHIIAPEGGTNNATVTITINVTPVEGTTVSKITKPDGTSVSNTATTTYDVTENDTYTFIVEGSDGGKTTYEVEITNSKEVGAPIGDYVEYGIGYTDVYSGDEFTSATGWRIVDGGKKVTENVYKNVKIISTGVPVILRYHYGANSGNKLDIPAGANDWWGTKSQVTELYGTDIANKGYKYDSQKGGATCYYVITGLLKNFSSIPFKKQTTTPDWNCGRYTKIIINGIEEVGNITGDKFLLSSVASEVHNLSLEELNKARDYTGTNSTLTAVSSSTDGDIGLFYLRNLANEPKIKSVYTPKYTTSINPYYWLSYTTDNRDRINLGFTRPNGGYSATNGNGTPDINGYGLRPVISLTKNIKKKSDGHWIIVP